MRELRVCPNCGAYVITDRDVCPRCDAPLDEPAPQATAPDTETDDPVADVLAEIEAAQAPDDSDEQPGEPPTWLPHVEPAAQTAGESEATAPGEAEAASEAPPAREDRPTMPGWLPEATLPAVRVEPDTPDEDAHDRPTGPRLDVSGAESEAEVTLARLPEDIEEELSGGPSREPTLQFDRKLSAEPPREADVTSPAQPPGMVAAPPASALRPPAPVWSPQPYAAAQSYWDAATGFFQQRIQAYLNAGYQAHVHAAHEATLSYGKPLGAGGWLLAIVTLIGLLWYILIQAISGFRPDMAYLTLEADGRVYEDGPGAAHVRRQRSRSGRRWSLIGLTILVLSLVLAIVLGAVVGLALRDDQRRAAVSQIDLLGLPIAEVFEALDATPAITASAEDIASAENAAVVVSLLGALALLGIWAGATLLVIGTIHARAFRTRVPALPGYA